MGLQMKDDYTKKLSEALDRLRNLSYSPPQLEEDTNESNYLDEKSKQALRHSDDLHKQALENESQNIKLRYQFANNVYWLTVATLVAILYLIIHSGMANLYNHQFLSDRILVALLSFAGLDMFGLFAIILTYLFRKPKQ